MEVAARLFACLCIWSHLPTLTGGPLITVFGIVGSLLLFHYVISLPIEALDLDILVIASLLFTLGRVDWSSLGNGAWHGQSPSSDCSNFSLRLHSQT